MNKLVIIVLIFLCQASYSQRTFSKDELRADAEILFQALNELHPGLYRHSDTATIETTYYELQNAFSDGIDEETAFLYFSAFIARVKCGHTYPNPFNQKNNIIPSVINQSVLLPFTFAIINNQIVVDKPLDDKIKKHTVITHLNGIEVENIVDSLTHFIKADGNRTRKRMKDLEVQLTSKYEYFDYYFPMVYNFADSIKVSTQKGDTITLQLLTKGKRDSIYTKSYPNSNMSNYDNLWSKEINEEYAYLRLGTFVTWRLSFDWKDYLEDFFDELQFKGIEDLIIDIRGNEGGLTEVTEYLVSKLAKVEGETVFRKPHLAYKKVNDNLRPYLTTWSKWFYNTSLWTKKLKDNYRTIKFSANKAQRIKKNKNAFRGDSYLLIDESNSSATFILAEICKKNNYATLIGTETGGTKKGITAGQIFFLTLPNTKIEVDIPLIGRYPMKSLVDEGIKPDFWVAGTLQGYISNRDEQLEKAIEMINNK
jgi:C-terminal processing protease CtpA/Prc